MGGLALVVEVAEGLPVLQLYRSYKLVSFLGNAYFFGEGFPKPWWKEFGGLVDCPDINLIRGYQTHSKDCSPLMPLGIRTLCTY